VTTPALIKSNKKSPSIAAKSTFQRFCRKIEGLQSRIKAAEEQSEQALLVYHSKLVPMEKKLADLITRFILKVRGLTRDSKILSKKERAVLNEFFGEDLILLSNLVPQHQLEDEIKELYREIHGKTPEEIFNEELSGFKDTLCKEGIIDDLDLTDLDPKEDFQEQIFFRIQQAMKEKFADNKDTESPPPKPKSKKELLKEDKARQLEALQSKGIGSIYRRLVKELHPDLEQDPKKRQEKDLLMKRLTVAYENRDLMALLALESEWLGHQERDDAFNEETLKVYNSLLKEQIVDLEKQLKLVPMNPRYFDIHRFIQDDLRNLKEAVKSAIEECSCLTAHYEMRLKDVSGSDPIRALKIALSGFAANQETEDDMIDFLDFIGSFSQPQVSKRKPSRR
jgi:hypothetical protein